jgi:hypothetical protein
MNEEVKTHAAFNVGKAYAHAPDKSQAWEDLIRLSKNYNYSTRVAAFYSLGRASIFKAQRQKTIRFSSAILNRLLISSRGPPR